MMMRATTLAEKNGEFEDQVVQMWLCIAHGCRSLKNSLQHNVLWSSREKEWFVLVKDEKDGVDYCLNHVMPRWLKKNSAVKDFADDQEIIFLF